MKHKKSTTRLKDIINLKKQTLIEYIKSYDKVKDNKSQILSFYLIRQMEDEIFHLKKLNQKRQHEVNKYFSKLDQIYHSKTWKLLGLFKYTQKQIFGFIKYIIPISLRKKLKSRVTATFFPKPVFSLPINIKKEWQQYKRTDSSIDLLNFSIIAWNFRFQRPQQLAQQIAQKGNRIFYIKNEFTPGIIENGFAPFLVKKIQKNIYEITLSASRNLFIYDDKPSSKDLQVIMASVKNLINNANIINPVAKFDHPFWSHLLKKLSMPIIYDCMDNHQGFSETGSHLKSLEQKLFQQADITLATSQYLHKVATKNKAKHITLVPNASDFDHFSQAIQQIDPIPNDLRRINKPIIGYYGAIAEWFDTSILEDIAKNHQDKSIVLIGQVTNHKVEKLSRQYPNIFLLGEKKYQDLPAYLSHFDVCIIPFIINELIKATHPVKVYEYLAAGKPVVTTKMPEIANHSDVICLSSAKDFSSNITIALEQSKSGQKERQQIAKDNTWIARSDQILKTIDHFLFPKISIIILSYNHPDLMKLTIDSVSNQSFYPNMEIIIVDNNSNTETIQLLKKYQSQSNIKIIFNKTNYGFAKGNNIGLKAATGDYLILLNNDVIVTPGWISRLLFHLNNKSNIGLVGPVTNSIGNEAKIDITYDYHNQNQIITNALKYTSKHWGDTLKVNNIAAFCWIVSCQTYQKFGGLDERFGQGMFEDDDYCHRIITSGKEILIADDVFIHHFGGASFKQIKSADYQKLFNNNKTKFEDKWHTKWVPHKYRLQIK